MGLEAVDMALPEGVGAPVRQLPRLVSLAGQMLLDTPLLNKGSAFSEEERREFGLLGLLPPHVSTLDEQLARAYGNYTGKTSDLERYIFLIALQDRNETLFYRLVHDHITEMMPVIYTPGVGAGCQQYSHIYRRPRGLYISYPHVDDIDEMLGNVPSAPEVIVVTDGERILGLGDLGVGGMGIPIGKLSLYTVCAGIDPTVTLPILLDVGTNNESLLADPLYLGWRRRRVSVEEYDDFVDAFVSAIARRFPRVLLQWEDFSKHNAARLLARYRNRLCTFNDDIQGTGAVTLAGILAAGAVTGQRITGQRVVILGAGSSAIGISDQLVAAMATDGASPAEARAAIWLVDSQGLVHSGRGDLGPSKQAYAQPLERTAAWGLPPGDRIDLADVVRHVHPTVLIGTSAQTGAFTEDVIREMASATPRPIVFPLSNPTSRSEATPADLLAWTEGRALVATGSPFADVWYDGRTLRIGQCNNAFIFPGVGLGVLASGAPRVTDEMFVVAARALSEWSPARREPDASLYPPLERVREVARDVAVAVALEAHRAGLTEGVSRDDLPGRIEACMWEPDYVPYTRVRAVAPESSA
jgi:malate dehydrogenase (oxaloacetate-decarboxylating)